ncbi:MAG: phosphatidate cytidylyltransferase [Clostridiales bacterium]|nr:phosphatidate cytidylyltransferase [Clostridiales bacterium]
MKEFFLDFGAVLLYFIIAATSAILVKLFTKVPHEVFRKLLHCILLGSLLIWTLVFDVWWKALLSVVLFVLPVYPVLHFAEDRIKAYSSVLEERKKGELKNSLLVVFLMFAIVLSICWGWLGDKLLTLASVYAWGFGDAAAALIGKQYGKHKIGSSKKSWEGTLSMFLVSFLCVAAILLYRGGLSWFHCLWIAAVTAVASAAAEFYTKNGLDTFTCPVAAMIVLLPLVHWMGGGI